jgi:hypothetical protein
MSESYGALCSDFYVNQKLALKMDLPRDRQTTLDLFDRIRREHPSMNQFRRYREELALESAQGESQQQWLSIRQTHIRSGYVNPTRLADAYRFHSNILTVVPFFLSISPLDVDSLELMFGFDLAAGGNHDEIVYQALFHGSPHAALLDIEGAAPIDCQPVFGVRLGDPVPCDAHFEVKTRSTRRDHDREGSEEPISVFLTLRRHGPFNDVKELPGLVRSLAERGEELVESKVIPQLVGPIREAIGTA